MQVWSMTKDELEQLEKQLLRERERVIKALRILDDSVSPTSGDGDLTTYPLHLADEGTDTMEQEQSFLLLSECGKAVGFARLEIVPWARMCVDDQREFESRPVPVTPAA
jgi:RNA polymerase-binding transcription factor DksA